MKKNIIIGVLIMMVIILSAVIFYVVHENKNIEIEKEKLQEMREKEKAEKAKQNIVLDDELLINKAEVTTENDFINYLDDVSYEVNRIADAKTVDKSDENILKNTFITLTDFIFYDGEIKGKKFSELTAECKEKVIDIYTKIDSKIEEKFPNYKENIKSTSKKVYSNVKDKVIDIKGKIQEEYKERVGDEGYQNTVDAYNEDKENVKDVYDTYKPYIDASKEKAKSTYDKAKEKVSNWYKDYKES